MAYNLAFYLFELFQVESLLKREIIRIERRRHLYDQIQVNHLKVDVPIFKNNVTIDLKKSFNKKEANSKYDFTNIKTFGKILIQISFFFYTKFVINFFF